jgi:hypothetical protein
MTSSAPGGDPIEEVFDDQPTGVELERDIVESSADKPWDPAQIRVATRQFSIRNVLDMIDEKALELAPDFQRNRVWKARQKSRLIESVILQIPLPAFYFAEDGDGQFRVVDGLQRLSTIHDFVRGGDERGFALAELEYLSEEQGKRFADLSAPFARRMNNAQIVVNVIDPVTPPEVTYNIFKRLNTGGSPLNTQEIRHCMSKGRSRAFLKRLTNMPEFLEAAGPALHNHVRMVDREVALRFCAFRIIGSEREHLVRGMDGFLEAATTILDDPHQISNEQLDELAESFGNAMANAKHVFGSHAFRKWPLGSEKISLFNRALFESWALALADAPRPQVARSAPAIARLAREAMSDNREYIDAITFTTNDPNKIDYRFKLAQLIIAEAAAR